MKVRSRAYRTRVWFKAISGVERAIIDLTIKCVENIRSVVLNGTISAIVSKILHCLEEGFMTRAEKVGRKVVESVCAAGKKWGNTTCSAWRYDQSFISFLGVNALNS